jgi:phosphatidylserine decarboxylase
MHSRLTFAWASQVHVIGALPLRSASRIYGALNSYTLPVWFRVPGFKLYATIFGVNLDECDPSDLTQYRSLSDFFMRQLKPGVRPIDEALVVRPLSTLFVASLVYLFG